MSVVSSALVVLRESFEAFLIVGIMAGLVTKLGAPEKRRIVYYGTAAGLLASVVVGWAMLRVAADLQETYEEAFAGVASIVAVLVLTYMIVWMYRHTTQIMGGMHAKIRAAIQDGALGALFFIPFIAVLREGFETVLFLATDGTTGGLALGGAVVIGLAGASLLAALLFSGVIRLNIRAFFGVTGGLLVVFAAWILQYGLHEIGEIVEKAGGEVHEFGELLAGPLSWVGAGLYLALFGAWYLKPMLRRTPQAAAVEPENA